jgi:hypothetical protein
MKLRQVRGVDNTRAPVMEIMKLHQVGVVDMEIMKLRQVTVVDTTLLEEIEACIWTHDVEPHAIYYKTTHTPDVEPLAIYYETICKFPTRAEMRDLAKVIGSKIQFVEYWFECHHLEKPYIPLPRLDQDKKRTMTHYFSTISTHPTKKQKVEISLELNMHYNQVHDWFKDRRRRNT